MHSCAHDIFLSPSSFDIKETMLFVLFLCIRNTLFNRTARFNGVFVVHLRSEEPFKVSFIYRIKISCESSCLFGHEPLFHYKIVLL